MRKVPSLGSSGHDMSSDVYQPVRREQPAVDTRIGHWDGPLVGVAHDLLRLVNRRFAGNRYVLAIHDLRDSPLETTMTHGVHELLTPNHSDQTSMLRDGQIAGTLPQGHGNGVVR